MSRRLKEGSFRADTVRMEPEGIVEELRQTLLEIEWTSRKSTSTATLRRITQLSREALGLLPQTTAAAALSDLGETSGAASSFRVLHH